MKSFYLTVILLLLIFTQVFAKITPKEKQQQLSENGISIIDDTKIYTDHQYYLLSTFDFNGYRNYSTKRLVQIEDGPIVELSSITEMQQSGRIIPAATAENKKNEISDSHLKTVITLVNIGFRYGPKKNTETGF
jgi:hypothetical protein